MTDLAKARFGLGAAPPKELAVTAPVDSLLMGKRVHFMFPSFGETHYTDGNNRSDQWRLSISPHPGTLPLVPAVGAGWLIVPERGQLADCRTDLQAVSRWLAESVTVKMVLMLITDCFIG
ncbi:hypothetical protein CKO42_08180 [Lamprobacter modestohalophilus]|uniref:Uncharacterized protein n=1 Tax=Lamprobacter modestohalophilus TaxID=1064514 RepID=A0A9X0W7K4_9GAMM|nr:hypothetical protein [Lamprobacter modestohalophilus]MBK1618415.1 hypothetical protein [Lamprobacter modestohalophilus]